MKVGIYDVFEGEEMPHQKIYEQILSYNSISYTFLNINDDDFWLKLKDTDILMYKWRNNDNHHLLANILRPVLESLNIRFFPNSETSWHYDDKVKQYFLMVNHGMEPVPTHVFFHKNKAFDFINSTSFPIVAKLKKGASSSNVLLIKNKKEAKKFVHKAFSIHGFNPNYFGSYAHLYKTLDSNPHDFLIYNLKRFKRFIEGRDGAYWERHKNYVLFQDYLPGNEYDTRVTTVGNRVHAFRRFVRKNDFRASGGPNWDINPDKIDNRMLQMALSFSKKMNFQTMAYDFIYDKDKNPKIVEISYLFGQPGYPDFMNGYWDENLNWIEGRFWPQHFKLVDALGIPDLKCPKIEVPREWIKNMII
jgi:glutathione synthase/RimK-type ligase-like ATP-grasp enzyme